MKELDGEGEKCYNIGKEKTEDKDLLIGNAIVGQSGGPTAAINATLSGVIRGCLAHMGEGGCIRALYGMKNGIEGFLERRWVNLGERFSDETRLKILEQTPAAALGSCRKKLPDPNSEDPSAKKFYDEIFNIFREKDIRFFFYIGGNDSMDTVMKLRISAEKYNYEMRVVGVPKTIDNDLVGTDHTPGFGSAAKYLATTMQEILRDCAVYTTRAVTVVECMGRDAGWLTASTAIGRAAGRPAPDLVYLPERSFDMESFFTSIEEKFKEKPNLVVAVSEGLRFADGRYVGEGQQSGVADVFGHKYLSGTGKTLEFAIKERFGCKVRSVELNLPQRCAAHLLSDTDIRESIEIGKAAANAAAEGKSGGVMMLRRKDTSDYQYELCFTDVNLVANQTRYVPDDFINGAGNDVTDACCEYLLPLIRGERELMYENGLPLHVIIE